MNLLKSFLLFVILISSLKFIQADVESDIQVIKDVLDVMPARTTTVVAFVCWIKENKMKLLNKLLEYNYMSSVLDLNEQYVQNVYPNFKQTLILDTNCKNYLNILKKANNELLFSTYSTWILLSNSTTISDEISLNFIQFDMFPNSNVLLLHKIKNDNYLLKEIYKLTTESTDIIINVVSTWKQNNKFINLSKRILANDRQNLNKTLLSACIVILDNDTLNHLDDYRDKHIDSITKVNYVLIKHLVEYVNGILRIYTADSWGYLNKTSNTYNGMIGNIESKKSEIGGTALFMTTDRVPIVDYIAMTTPTRVRFVFRQPPLSYEQNIFTLPFTKELWISSICLVLLAILLLYFTVFWTLNEPPIQEDPSVLHNSFLDVVMLTFAAVAQQGSSFEPRNGSGKIIMIFTFIALMFLYVSYSANIVALLQSSATNIRTLEDLLESRMTLGADDNVYNRYYMSTANEPVRKAIYEKKIAPPGQDAHFAALDEGVKRIRDGFYAFHMELGRGYKLIADTFYENEKCGIQEINYLNVVDTYLAVKKNSSYKELFILGLRKIRESGIQTRELSKIYTNKPECRTSGANFVSVGLVDSYPAFVFLAAGIGVSLTLFFLENVFSKNVNVHKICVKINK